jgi:uncharacterized membrane protein
MKPSSMISSKLFATLLVASVLLQATAFVPSAQSHQACAALKRCSFVAAAPETKAVALHMSSDALNEVRAWAGTSSAFGTSFEIDYNARSLMR